MTAKLDGRTVAVIHADLTAGSEAWADLTTAKRLPENDSTCFEGIKKYGAFDVPGSQIRRWLPIGGNPNGRPNADVLKPWINATDVVRRDSDTWVIDFTDLSESAAALYEVPFLHAQSHVKLERARDRNKRTREIWWMFERARPELRKACAELPRYIVTPVVAKHRVFTWRSAPTLPMNLLDVIARADDTTFGILHSRFHELWALRMGTSLEDRPRYTPTTTFETFPFPEGLTPADTAGPIETLDSGAILPPVADSRRGAALAIAEAAHRLNALRENWLNPPEWVDRVPEVVPGFPDRIIPKPEYVAELKKRTLTNLYNARPAWLDNAHKALDAAVAIAYGWEDYGAKMAEEEILRRLLAINLERSKETH